MTSIRSISLDRLRLLLLAVVLLTGCGKGSPEQFQSWRVYSGDQEGTRYSALDQINRANVNGLEVAWVFHTGDKRDQPLSTIECNPIIVDDIMYVTSPAFKVIALKADTGKQIWRFDPFEDREVYGVNRGVTYWEDGTDKRILFTAANHLYALDASTGIPIPSFGNEGKLDLRLGLDRDIGGALIAATSPGIIYQNLLILGSTVGEGPQPAAPGHVRAYDVRSGEVVWIFHTIPHPGEYGYETWPEDAWERVGGANVWGGMTLDESRGMVFMATGSATFDFYGGDRHGQNLFANSVIALKASTGERVWHFQTVHHDIWDYDIPTQPNLVTIRRNGNLIDAVAQVTKMGLVFVFDRETGEPLFPVEERVVPSSILEGEASWTTQPFPLKPPPFVRHAFTEDEITDVSPEAHAYAAERLKELGPSTIYTPPSEQGAIIFPGYHGGANWGGAAFDPEGGMLYINANEIPWVATMERVTVDPVSSAAVSVGESVYGDYCVSCHAAEDSDQPSPYASLNAIRKNLTRTQLTSLLAEGKGDMPSFNQLKGAQLDALYGFLSGSRNLARGSDRVYDYPYVFAGYQRFLDKEGFPAVKPPWGTLNAIDLNRGEIVWKVPLGEIADLAARGVPPTGTETFGGPIVTAGGLLFIGATKDKTFRAFDTATGKVLWEAPLPAGGMATPATYAVDGRQYVVIAAGGGKGRRAADREDRESGDAYVAFALPEQ